MCGVAHRRGDLYVIVFLLSYNTHITNMFRILYKCHIVSYNFNVIKYSYDIHITTYPYIAVRVMNRLVLVLVNVLLLLILMSNANVITNTHE